MVVQILYASQNLSRDMFEKKIKDHLEKAGFENGWVDGQILFLALKSRNLIYKLMPGHCHCLIDNSFDNQLPHPRTFFLIFIFFINY